MTRTTTISTLSALALAATAGLLVAGPLNPPAGPVASSYKTLAEVEPRIPINAANTPGDADSVYRITQPGSYYLTGNITGAANKAAIEVAASNVTIDLGGFALQGVASSLDGIRSTAAIANTCVRNGSISGFANDGIDLSVGGAATGVLVEGVRVANNGQLGIRVDDNAVVRGCTATSNGNAGINLNSGVVEGCTAQGNGSQGISVLISGVVRGCTSRENSSSGISVGYDSVVTACSSYGNGGFGISATSYTLVESCTTRSNTAAGITVNNSSVVRGCICTANGVANSEAGIYCVGSHNRIEGNTCASNGRGVFAGNGSFNNFIVRNICSGNTTNWDIAAANALGPIVVVSSNPGGVSGNSYAGNLGSTDPNANFTY